MTTLFRAMPMRWKVVAVVMAVASVVLLISGVLVVVADVMSMRQGLLERVGALSRVAAINTSAALAFQDPEAAEEVLAALGSEPEVLRIQIRDAQGRLFAEYRSQQSGRALSLVEDERLEREAGLSWDLSTTDARMEMREGYLDVDRPVLVNGKIIGEMDLQYDTAQLGARIADQLALAIAVFCGGVVLAFVLALRLHRLISRPIGEIAEAMEATAASQDFSIRIDSSQPDELGALAHAFNVMLEQIEVRDVELRKARDEAEAGSQAKSQFLASMSHEIRTPMNGILGMAELLQTSTLSARQRHFAQTIQRSAESLLGIINDILDFSKIEAGRLELELIDFDLCETVEQTTELLAEVARAKGLQLRTRISSGVISHVRGDPGRLQQVLTNLLSNAIKFTEDGRVQLTLALVEERERSVLVRFEVADTGIGLSAVERERIFERFSQGDSSTSRRYGGTGLGLSITKQLVELMGGEIAVDAAAERGSVFRIDLPLELQPRPTSVPEARFAGRRALLVSSDPSIRERLAEIFEEWRVDLIWEPDLRDALELALTEAASGRGLDVLLMDRQSLPALEVPSGRVLRGVIAHVPATVLLCDSHDDSGVDQAWGKLRVVVTPIAAKDLARCLDAMIGTQAPQGVRQDSQASGGAPAEIAQLGLQVLVAEDNHVNQEVVGSMLEALGCQSTICADGREVLERLSRESFDIVLMDCQMPIMDGYETTRRIRALEVERGGRLPVVALTAHAMRGDRERALSAGMDDYLRKPFSLGELCALLKRATASAESAG